MIYVNVSDWSQKQNSSEFGTRAKANDDCHNANSYHHFNVYAARAWTAKVVLATRYLQLEESRGIHVMELFDSVHQAAVLNTATHWKFVTRKDDKEWDLNSTQHQNAIMREIAALQPYLFVATPTELWTETATTFAVKCIVKPAFADAASLLNMAALCLCPTCSSFRSSIPSGNGARWAPLSLLEHAAEGQTQVTNDPTAYIASPIYLWNSEAYAPTLLP